MAGELAQDPAGFVLETVTAKRQSREQLLWLNHYDLLPGDSTVTVTHESTTSGVGGGLTALVVHSSTTGELDSKGGNKVVHMAVAVPPGFTVTGVRLGYELTSRETHVSQIRLAQVQDPPKVAAVLLDDGTDHTDMGPIYVDSGATSIDPPAGPLLLSLRVKYRSTSDVIAIRGLALRLAPNK